MNGITKIKKLEKMAKHITMNRNQGLTLRYISEDGRYIDEEGYLLSEEEIRLMKIENEEITNNGGTVINYSSLMEAKIRQ